MPSDESADFASYIADVVQGAITLPCADFIMHPDGMPENQMIYVAVEDQAFYRITVEKVLVK